jgi:hypothetical protein
METGVEAFGEKISLAPVESSTGGAPQATFHRGEIISCSNNPPHKALERSHHFLINEKWGLDLPSMPSSLTRYFNTYFVRILALSIGVIRTDAIVVSGPWA